MQTGFIGYVLFIVMFQRGVRNSMNLPAEAESLLLGYIKQYYLNFNEYIIRDMAVEYLPNLKLNKRGSLLLGIVLS